MRQPDFIIGTKENPYIRRWWIIPRNRFFNIYLHQILRSDDDRALHDHPWWNISVILKGGYLEWTPFKGDAQNPSFKTRLAGDIIFRRGKSPHRLEILPGFEKEAWSLFITGPKLRDWGFYCPQGWKHWKDFTKAGEPGQIGPGCGE